MGWPSLSDVGNAWNSVRNTVSNGADAVSNTVSSAATTVRSTVSSTVTTVRETASVATSRVSDFAASARDRAVDLARDGADLGRRGIEAARSFDVREAASAARAGIARGTEAAREGISTATTWSSERVGDGADWARNHVPGGDNIASNAVRSVISGAESTTRFQLGVTGGIAREVVGTVGAVGQLTVTAAEMQASPEASREYGDRIAGAIGDGARATGGYLQSVANDPTRLGRDAQGAWDATSGFVGDTASRYGQAIREGRTEEIGMDVGTVATYLVPVGGGPARGALTAAVRGGTEAAVRGTVEVAARTAVREGGEAVVRSGAEAALARGGTTLTEQRGADLVQRMVAGGGTAPLPNGAGRIADVAAAARQSGSEIAVYRDATTGVRNITMGSADAVSVPAGSRLVAHTQPGVGPAALTPSAADLSGLGALGQRSSAIIDQGGGIARFGIDDVGRAASGRAAVDDVVTFRAPDGLGRVDPPLIAQNPLLTSAPNAHAVARHGGVVTNEQLAVRARTGLTPDGFAASVPPKLSTAFHSDALLVSTDRAIREGGALQAAIAAAPAGVDRVVVSAAQVGDLGQDLGRGFERIGKARDLQGPLREVTDLRSAEGVYARNAYGQWETVTLYPAKVVP